MGTTQIQFDDGAAYERYMGMWSQLVGEEFLAWLAAPSGLRWLDIGCGSGAFTELIVGRTSPAAIQGLDPSNEQLEYARARPALRLGEFRQGNAMELPYSDNSFDAAVMPLVIFFVPEPAKGVAEMARVVAPGGMVTAYAWDMLGGGFPYALLQAEIRNLGFAVPSAPSVEASRLDVLQELWTGAGLEAVETRVLTVARTFADFNDYWSIVLGGSSVKASLATMAPDDLERLKKRLQECLPTDSSGRITIDASANAVKGRVPTAS